MKMRRTACISKNSRPPACRFDQEASCAWVTAHPDTTELWKRDGQPSTIVIG